LGGGRGGGWEGSRGVVGEGWGWSLLGGLQNCGAAGTSLMKKGDVNGKIELAPIRKEKKTGLEKVEGTRIPIKSVLPRLTGTIGTSPKSKR